jgi:hypothetical protein
MANKYWVGGNGTWDNDNKLNWSDFSGYAGGADVPGPLDVCIFDVGSASGIVTFNNTVNPNITQLILGGGVILTLNAPLAVSGNCSITQGDFYTSGNTFSCNSFLVSGVPSKIINFGASAVTIGSNFTLNAPSLTFTAGTSTINMEAASATFAGGSKTFYNVNFYSTAITTVNITGANAFNELRIASRSALGVSTVTFSDNQTIASLVLLPSSSPINRNFLRSNTTGAQRTLDCEAISSGIANYDFRDIAIGTTTLTGLRLGDCGNTNGISFPEPKTVFYRATGSANWGATTSWSQFSESEANENYFPLAQDTAFFPAATYPASGSTVTINASYNIGTIDMSERTSNTMTLAIGTTTPTIYGNWINGTGTAANILGSGTFTFGGRTTQQITSRNKTFLTNITVDNANGTLQLQDPLTVTTNQDTTLLSGTLDLNNHQLSTGAFQSNIDGPLRTLAFGATGILALTGTGIVWDTTPEAGFSTTGSKTVNITSTGSTAISIDTGNLTEDIAPDFNLTGGTYSFGSTDASIRNLNFTGYSGAWSFSIESRIYRNLTLSSGMSIAAGTGTLKFVGTSGTQTFTTQNKTIDRPVQINAPGGGIQLVGDLTVGNTRSLTLAAGTFDMNGYNVNAPSFNLSGSSTRTFAVGSGTMSLFVGSSTMFNAGTGANLTVTGTGVINMSNVFAGTFVGGGIQTYPTLNISGSLVTVTGSNKFKDITNTANGTAVAFTSGTTNEFDAFNLSGTIDGFFNITSSSPPTRATLKKPTAPWYVGANSANDGNNTGLVFVAGDGIDYLRIANIIGTGASSAGGNFFAFF